MQLVVLGTLNLSTNTNDEKWETFQTVYNCLPILVNINSYLKMTFIFVNDIWSFFQIWVLL